MFQDWQGVSRRSHRDSLILSKRKKRRSVSFTPGVWERTTDRIGPRFNAGRGNATPARGGKRKEEERRRREGRGEEGTIRLTHPLGAKMPRIFALTRFQAISPTALESRNTKKRKGKDKHIPSNPALIKNNTTTSIRNESVMMRKRKSHQARVNLRRTPR